MADASNDARGKLQAVIVHRRGPPDDDPSPAYSAACREWFASLSDAQKALTDAAMIIYENGDEPGAAQIPANLPPAPKRPL
jgi:hypothetical protein